MQDKRGRMVCYQLRLTEEPGCALRVRKGTREEQGLRYSRVQSLYEFLYEPRASSRKKTSASCACFRH